MVMSHNFNDCNNSVIDIKRLKDLSASKQKTNNKNKKHEIINNLFCSARECVNLKTLCKH